MATPKQIAANRRNAQKSCGAKTEAGKAMSPRTALSTASPAHSKSCSASARPITTTS